MKALTSIKAYMLAPRAQISTPLSYSVAFPCSCFSAIILGAKYAIVPFSLCCRIQVYNNSLAVAQGDNREILRINISMHDVVLLIQMRKSGHEILPKRPFGRKFGFMMTENFS